MLHCRGKKFPPCGCRCSSSGLGGKRAAVGDQAAGGRSPKGPRGLSWPTLRGERGTMALGVRFPLPPSFGEGCGKPGGSHCSKGSDFRPNFPLLLALPLRAVTWSSVLRGSPDPAGAWLPLRAAEPLTLIYILVNCLHPLVSSSFSLLKMQSLLMSVNETHLKGIAPSLNPPWLNDQRKLPPPS